MSDKRLRELERRWRASGTESDRKLYTLELKRAGQHEKVARIYSPLLEENVSAELRQEYLLSSPLTFGDSGALEHILLPNKALHLFADRRIWLIGSALTRTTYNDIDLVISCNSDTEPTLRQHRHLSNILKNMSSEETNIVYAESDIHHRIRGTLHGTPYDLLFTHDPFSVDPDTLRVRLQ